MLDVEVLYLKRNGNSTNIVKVQKELIVNDSIYNVINIECLKLLTTLDGRVEAIKQDGEVVGNRTRVKVVKNKVAPPFREAEFDIVYGKGISKEGSVLDLAVTLDIIEKAGSWFSYNGEKIGQGRENVKKLLADDPKFMAEVEKKVRDNFNKAFENALGETEEDEEQEVEPNEDGE